MVLTREENELLTQVGPGTPMGDLMRQYWLPALLSAELPRPDGRPVRLRLLGEDLVAFRDTAAKVGLLAEHCPHRDASLFLGRNEESGLRCVYHGWKFDVTGRCVDMPNEPPESSFKEKIRQTAYRCEERQGVIWTYMGPLSEPPGLPELEWTVLPEEQRYITKRYQECNYAQALEGDIDSSHVSFLHSSLNQNTEYRGSARERGMSYMAKDRHPRFEAVDTDCGVLIGARRDAEEDTYYWRVTPFIMPFHVITPPYGDSPVHSNGWVPIDDDNTMVWSVDYHPTRALTEQELAHLHAGAIAHVPIDGFLPATFEAGSAWKPTANRRNNYLVDYEAQETTAFCGIKGFWCQDMAVVESMGRVRDRTREHLGTTDIGIIRVRRRLMAAAEALRKEGAPPPGLDPATQRVRSTSVVLPRGVSFVEGARDALVAHPGRPYASV
jgi:phthalate 4,5-dioxygenase oxygenase subunit